MGWYYAQAAADGSSQPVGPYDDAAFRQMFDSGILPPETLVYHAQHAPNWTTFQPEPTPPPLAVQPEPLPQSIVPYQQQAVVPIAVPVAQRVEPQAAVQVQPSQTVVIHHSGNDNNAAAIILNFLIWPGLGQLIQGRAGTGLLFMICWVVSLAAILVMGIGLITSPIIWLFAIIDAACYDSTPTYRRHRY